MVAFLLVMILTVTASHVAHTEPCGVPVYTGNMSVSPFMIYWGTAQPPANDLASRERSTLLRSLGSIADTDYLWWAVLEQQPGVLDFSAHRRNALLTRAAGMKYVPFLYAHFAPRWMIASDAFHPYICAEHGGRLNQLSPWSPEVWTVYRRLYQAMNDQMGSLIDWVRLNTPSDYGEMGYPAAMTSWLMPQAHAHAGYWCGDPYARADFRNEMRARFRRLIVLNARWGTSFASWDSVDLPDVRDQRASREARDAGTAQTRRRWLDFVEWYSGFWLRFTPQLAALVREILPDRPLITSVGYASEATVYGNDYSLMPKMAHQHDLALQTPGNVTYYALKRVSTACHHYGTRYYTEPPGDVPPAAQVDRLFHDAANGAQVFFDYPPNMDRAREQMRMYGLHLTGARPVVDVALYNPTVWHRLWEGRGNFPELTYLLGELGRDQFDYDVLDEYLVRDGALTRYRVLVWVEGDVTERFALQAVERWVRAGGVLVVRDGLRVEDVEKRTDIWDRLRPGPLGRGLVIAAGATGATPVDQAMSLADTVTRTAYHLSDIDRTRRNAPLIDGVRDGVRAVLLPDRILYLNSGDVAVTKRVSLRPVDWPVSGWSPERMDHTIYLPPHSIGSIGLVRRDAAKYAP